jgi:hypothetical protein
MLNTRLNAFKISALGVVLALALVLSYAPGAAPVAAQDVPVARISLPVRGQTLRGGVTIQGTAQSPLFVRFEVAYATEPDLANWTVLNGVLQPVENSSLAVWNTRPLADGKYALRLQVLNSDGSTNEVLVRDLTITNAAVGAPGATAITPTSGLTSSAVITADLAGTGAAGAKDQSIDLSTVPAAFLKGARYVLFAFLALGAYVLLKKILGALLRLVFKRPVDYGR